MVPCRSATGMIVLLLLVITGFVPPVVDADASPAVSTDEIKSLSSRIDAADGFCIITLDTIPVLHRRDPPPVPGYRLLEPLGGARYMAWRYSRQNVPATESAAPRNRNLPLSGDACGFGVVSATPLTPGNKIAATLKHDPSRDTHIGIWWLSVSGGLDIDGWIPSSGGTVIARDAIRMSDAVTYRITVARWETPAVETIVSIPNVRWIYPVPERPGLEDELASLEIVETPFHGGYSPGYTADLTDRRLSGEHTVIGYIDTGFDTNDNADCHPDVRGRILAYLTYPGSPQFDYVGHGTHVGGVLAGSGISGESDTDGFLLGCGLAPWSKLVVSDALLAAPWPPATGFGGMIRDVASAGADLCNNAWWDGEGVGIGYTANCALWDAAVRDASGGGGNGSGQPMAIFFSAGNRGPDPCTLTSPKEAKNIITVGASGSERAGNPTALWPDSSRGPCLDGRFAPTLAAPGTDIYSCWPGNIHVSLTGTSVAVPHATGLAAIAADFMRTRLGCMPSPALLKACLINLAEPAGDSYPDSGWGWGRLSLRRLPTRFPSLSWLDQSVLFTHTGDIFECDVIAFPGEPLRVTLNWTDPPAAPEADPALVNDLDLEVISRETVYRGNHFSGGYSIPGGDPDRLNNTEQVLIRDPATICRLRITAAAIPGDGVPGNGTLTDQDFALAVSGGVLLSSIPKLTADRSAITSPDRAGLSVMDPARSAQESVTVTAHALRSGTSLDIPLAKVTDGAGWFTGELLTASRTASPHRLLTTTDDDIEITYRSSNGTDISLHIKVDAEPPVITRFRLTDIRADETTLAWETSERCRCSVHFRRIPDGTFRSERETAYRSAHEVRLSELSSCSWYELYLTCEDESGNLLNTYNGQPHVYWITDRRKCIYFDTLDSDPEWPVMEGEWAWGIPEGAGSPRDPTAGYTGENVIGYNLSGNYANLLNREAAVGPVLDCSDPGDYRLEFHRWLGTRKVIEDEATVEVLGADGVWTAIYRNPLLDWYDGGWITCSYDVTDWASGNPAFQFRFVQGPTDIAFSSCGWNIDDIVLTRDEPCLAPTPTPPPARLEPVLTLHSDHYRYLPGMRLRLIADIDAPVACKNAVMVVALVSGNHYYFYPDWSSDGGMNQMDLSPGHQRILLLNMTVPEGLPEPIPLTFVGVIAAGTPQQTSPVTSITILLDPGNE